MHKCLFALIAALNTSALGARGSRKSALCCRSKTHALSLLGLAPARSRVCIGRNHRPIYAVNYEPFQGLVGRFA